MVHQTEANRVSFSSSTWISLLGLVVTGVATNLIMLYSMGFQLHERIDALDEKWQVRVIQLHSEFNADIDTLAERIPPEWFRSMVDANTRDIKRLENEFTRDFVR